MTITNVLLIIQSIIALGAGFYTARTFRKTISNLVFRLLPMRLRISETAINRHKRINAIAGVVLMTLTTGTVFMGTNQVLETLEWKKTSTSNVVPFKTLDAFPVPTPPEPKKVHIPQPYIAPTELTEIPIEYKTPKRQKKEPRLEDQYYLQIYAFSNYKKAKKIKRQWESKTVYDSYLATDHSDIPYKVLLGPFPTRDLAMKFNVRYNPIKGVPKSGENLKFYQD